MITWETPIVNAIDNSGNVSATCNPTDVPIGEATVTCEAVDGSGNKAECHILVNVTGNVLVNVTGTSVRFN